MSDDQTPHPPTGADPAPGPDAPDVAFARLRAADPAAHVTADLDGIRSAVAASTGVPVGAAAGSAATDAVSATAAAPAAGAVPTRGAASASGSTPGGDRAPLDELATARQRRAGRLRWLPAAAAVAGLAVVGGGGYAIGAGAQDGGSGATADLAGPAMSLEQPVGAADSDARESAAMGGTAATSKLAWFGGRVVFTAGTGLSDEAGSGTAWALDAAGVFSAESAARVAAALGVEGEPRGEYGSWVVGPTDGSGPTVSLSPDGFASVSFYDPSLDPWTCVRSAPETLDGAGAAGSTGAAEPAIVDPGTECTTPDLPPAPTGDAAKARAADVLTSLGVDPASHELEVAGDTGTPQLVQVAAHQVVDGQRTGQAWSVSLVGDGVQSLWGQLAPLVELGGYDVVSPRAAVERLGDPRFGAGGGVMPLAAADVARSPELSAIAPGPSEEPTVPPTASRGPIGWPVEQVTIESARLGLASTSLPTGAAVLLPTYELAAADGRTWTVVAVADDELDFSAER